MISSSGDIENLEERFEALKNQENSTSCCSNYLTLQNHTHSFKGPSEFLSNHGDTNIDATLLSKSILSVDDVLRVQICEWCYQVIDHLNFDREIVYVTLNYLDRYLSCSKVNKKTFQLAAMTSLYLAIKLYSPIKLPMSSMIGLSQHKFCLNQMVDMENDILGKLSWRVHPPTPIYFVSFFFQLLPAGCCSLALQLEVMELSRFLTELSVTDSFFISKRQSAIGLAALLNSMNYFSLPSSVIQIFMNNVWNVAKIECDSSDVDHCRSSLHKTYVQGGHYNNHSTTKVNFPISNHIRLDSPVGVDQFHSQESIIVNKRNTDLNQEYCNFEKEYTRQSRTKRSRN